ncbi:MAG: NHL repeat-containing protein [Thermodesulfobacteriota bacterium]
MRKTMPSRKPLPRRLLLALGPTLLLFALVCQAQENRLNTIACRQALVITDQLRLPSDVGVDGRGRIYILDGTASVVRIYDRLGMPAGTLGGASVLREPLGIDVSAGGDVLVADSGNRRLVLFPADHINSPRFITIPAPPGTPPPDPTDAVFGLQPGTFHVVDNDNHRIVTLDQNGSLLWATGIMGRNREEFRFPFMLDLDGEGNIYIVEVINTRVQVLTANGTYSRFIGDWGIEPGQFFRPKGVAVSDRNEVFVSDSYLGVIQVFSREGRFLGAVGDEDGNLLKFTTPVGMAVAGNLLFLIEMWNNRLLVLERIAP